jgi:hypothetical protein
VEGEPGRTRMRLALDEERHAADADGLMRRFRDFVDENVLGGARGMPTLADPAAPGKAR